MPHLLRRDAVLGEARECERHRPTFGVLFRLGQPSRVSVLVSLCKDSGLDAEGSLRGVVDEREPPDQVCRASGIYPNFCPKSRQQFGKATPNESLRALRKHIIFFDTKNIKSPS